jgi:single-stranded-DNA-specific exonuclease
VRRTHTPKRWQILPGDIQAEARLQIELGAHPIVARLLAQRGLTTPEAADRFLNPTLDRLHDPFLLPDVEAACDRLKRALANREKILVHGDYDGDGLTSAALWTRVLRKLEADVSVFVPHRKRDGYDMRVPIVEQARQDGVSLIVTTDCGIQRIEEVEHARQYGIDVIITDHHTPQTSGALPKAVAVINPQRPDSRYPFRHLAGVGVAFKVCEALCVSLGYKAAHFRRGYLDLAAIGTVTDIMPLLDENRILVKHGLEALQNTNKIGLKALLAAAGHNPMKPITTETIGFQLGPRLNAASRIEETRHALDLLLTKEWDEAERLARKLNELNSARREQQERILEEALAQLAQKDLEETRCLVLAAPGWSGSIVGIVASKLLERCHRPCILIATDEATGTGRGSARSIHAFNIFEAIDQCSPLLEEYGGHAHAAGLSIQTENIEDFAAQMNRIARRMLSEEDLMPALEVAMEIAPAEVCPELLHQIAAMAPFGSANRSPLFVSRDMPIQKVDRMGKGDQAGKHLCLTLRAEGLNRSDSVRCPWFRHGDLADALEPGMSLDICYRPEFDTWRNDGSIQFQIEDVRSPEW